jgi:hypothetical protein
MPGATITLRLCSETVGPAVARGPVAGPVNAPLLKANRVVNCPIGYQLFRKYREAVKKWVSSINELRDGHDDRLMARIEESRFQVAQTRQSYQDHVRKHHCAAWKVHKPKSPK